MTCYHPLHGFNVGIWPDSGKPKYVIRSHDVNYLWFDGNNYISFGSRPGGVNSNMDIYSSPIDIPCGQCIGCRLDYAKTWALRCMLEAQYHSENWFVTLTYDDAHLPRSDVFDSYTGEIFANPFPTLRLKDVQDFLKRLRKNSGQKIRVYYCGEYGGETFRPHYHLIIFGLHLDPSEVRVLKKNYRGDIYYRSDLIEKCWKFGYSMVAEVNFDTCSYVARYMLKKQKGDDAAVMREFGLEIPFSHASNRPGIARQYYDEHSGDIYKYDNILLSTKNGGLKLRPPKYFDRLYDIDYPSDFENVREKRALVAQLHRQQIDQQTGDYYQYLSDEERRRKDRLGKFLKERSNIL